MAEEIRVNYPLPDLDPRPDLGDDHEHWRSLLLHAYILDHADPSGMFQALSTLRCLGASLARRETGRLTIAAGEIPDDEYRAKRAWLVPHRELLGVLLDQVGAA